jgi:hypothetical protein
MAEWDTGFVFSRELQGIDMTDSHFIVRRPTRASFKGGRAIHDIYDGQGVKWIAKGQFLTEKQIEIALAKGSLTRASFNAKNITPTPVSLSDLKPTFTDVVKLTSEIEHVENTKQNDLQHSGKLSEKTQSLIQESSEHILDLLASNQFSPYKLTGLTTFLYGEPSFQTKRPFLKTLNNSGTQHTLFSGIMTDRLNELVVANLLNPYSTMSHFNLDETLPLKKEDYKAQCQQTSQRLLDAIAETTLSTPLVRDLIKYFSPHLYFTSPEIRLFQQINQYVNYVMPETLSEASEFQLSQIPVINLANYFKQPEMGGGLGIEGSRIVQYVGLLPPGTAIQFNNREKGVIIAPKAKDTLYCVVITGMDGHPLISPSLKEIQFRDLDKAYRIIPSSDLPLKFEEHSHEKIWKMHIVHEKLKSQTQ